MPSQLGLQASVCQSDDAETLFSETFQYLRKILRHYRAQWESVFETLNDTAME